MDGGLRFTFCSALICFYLQDLSDSIATKNIAFMLIGIKMENTNFSWVQMDKKAETLMQDIMFPRRTYTCLGRLRAMREDTLVSWHLHNVERMYFKHHLVHVSEKNSCTM